MNHFSKISSPKTATSSCYTNTFVPPQCSLKTTSSNPEQTNTMKSKLATLMLIGIFFCGLAVAQPVQSGDAAASPDSTNVAAADMAPAADAAPAADTNAAAAAPAVPADSQAESATTAAAPGDSQAEAAPATNAAESSQTTVASAEAPFMEPAHDAEGMIPEEVIPLIQFQDVQLTTAIENLARQAGINYILDPKVGYGQPDERGQIRPQPSITLRWEKITASQALAALLQNYGLQMISDPKAKIARITVKDPAAPDPLVTQIIQLKFISVSNIVGSVQATLWDKRSKVIGDVRSSQLVVVATEKEQDAVQKLIDRLDTQTKQVLVEARILETTLNPKTSKGIDWTKTLGAQNVTFGNGNISGTTKTLDPANNTGTTPGGRPVNSSGRSEITETTTTFGQGLGGLAYSTASGFTPGVGFLNADGVNATLSFLNSSDDTKVISEPRMVTLDNQKATIAVGLLYPIVNTTAGTANTTGGSQISYSNLTVNLDVVPRITANNFIELKVQQSILRLGPPVQSTVGGVNNDVDSFFARNLNTTVLIPSGNTLVMGGLISDETFNGNTKVPLLGDLPGVGLLFRKDSKELNRNNLIIFITPTVVEDTDFRPTKTDYLKTTGNEKLDEGWTYWDSGKPYDWSKGQTASQAKGTAAYSSDPLKPEQPTTASPSKSTP
jgi:type II secretory pathway component GspD/PulD (secretin)